MAFVRLLARLALVVALAAGVGTATAQPRAAGDPTPAELERGCDGGDMTACDRLGLVYHRAGGFLSTDPQRALALYTKACEGGHPIACTALGTMYQRGEGTSKDAERGQAFHERGMQLMLEQWCDAGHASSCATLGTLYLEGRGGVPRDEARAVPLLERGCQAGLAWACSRLKR